MQLNHPVISIKRIGEHIKKYWPAILPILLIFSRGIADVTVLVISLCFLNKSYQSNDWAWLKQTWFKFSLIFWLYLLCINAPLSIQPAESMAYALFYLRWPLFAMALSHWLFIDSRHQRLFLIGLVVAFLFVLSDTALQYLIGHDLFGHAKASATRLTGPYSRPVPGIMMLRILFIALFLALFAPFNHQPKKSIIFILSILLSGFMLIFISGERMALMLCFTGSIIIVIGLLATHHISKKQILLTLTLTIGLMTISILSNPEMAERSIYSISDKLANFKTSDYGLVFRAAFAAWQQYPVLGSGFHTYNTVCNAMGLLPAWGIQCSHPHNLYLHITAETGVIGLLLFTTSIVSIYFAALKPLIQLKNWLLSSICFTVLSVCFFPLIGGISLLNNGVAALVWLGVGWVLLMSKKPSQTS